MAGGSVRAGALEIGAYEPMAGSHWMNLAAAMAARYMPTPNTA